jgi:hypothetical protein
MPDQLQVSRVVDFRNYRAPKQENTRGDTCRRLAEGRIISNAMIEDMGKYLVIPGPVEGAVLMIKWGTAAKVPPSSRSFGRGSSSYKPCLGKSSHATAFRLLI